MPKERFITYPHCNRDAERTPVIGWAGWDQWQQAQAVAGYYERMRTNEGWLNDRLLPLLGSVLELLPWGSNGTMLLIRNIGWGSAIPN
ncbi:MAG: hypothetical protein JWM99_5196, partial [Verrucomicrobiales bacterium]|nr:hypothetical protein [Verrucomicrobiales bacterium]